MAGKPDPDETRTVLRTAPASRARVRLDGWRHTLVVVQGAEPGRRYVIGDAGLTVGRRQGVDVVVAEPDVSAAHCRVHAAPNPEVLLVTDLQSTNGSFVNGRRVRETMPLPAGALLQVGSHILRHELQPADLADAALEVDRDLDRAGRYVLALLPAPFASESLRAEWCYHPSARLGGDAFGYFALDEQRFAVFVIDVCGHGAGSAMHAVSVLNVMRARALPETDFGRPEDVLARLNTMFAMEEHNGLYFTMWYGVHDARKRTLVHAAAGHHPAYLRLPDGELQPLQVRNPMVGVVPGHAYRAASAAVPSGSRLYAFSDGAFEFTGRDDRMHGLADFVALLAEPEEPGLTEPERLYRRVVAAARSPLLDDDFSVLTIGFLG